MDSWVILSGWDRIFCMIEKVFCVCAIVSAGNEGTKNTSWKSTSCELQPAEVHMQVRTPQHFIRDTTLLKQLQAVWLEMSFL